MIARLPNEVLPSLTAPAQRFSVARVELDSRLLRVLASKAIRRGLREQGKLNLQAVAALAEHELAGAGVRATASGSCDSLDVHQRLVLGLPGQALFIASALAFDSLQEALPYFNVTAKTAWQKLEGGLSTAQSEQALRFARVATLAARMLGSFDSGRRYLRTPNFALGGATPLQLLATAQGEQIVLTELQTQSDGGPV